MFFIYFLTSFSRSFHQNLTMKGLKCNKSPAILSKSPLFSPNIQLTYSTLHLSKFFISKSFSHFIYTINVKMDISLNYVKLNSFLSQAIFINGNKCSFPRPVTNLNYRFEYKDCETNGSIARDPAYDGCSQRLSSGGAIYVTGVKELILKNVNFTYCACVGRGGAAYIEQAELLTIDSCRFISCSAGIEGADAECYRGSGAAALAITSCTKGTIENTNFTGNFVHDTKKNIINCTMLIFDPDMESYIQIGDYTMFNNTVSYDIYILCEKSNSKFEISYTCFMTDTNRPIYLENSINYFNCTHCSFIKDEFSKADIMLSPDNTNIILTDNKFLANIKCEYDPASYYFSVSDEFTPSVYFTHSIDFTGSNAFTESGDFSSSFGFTSSAFFSRSDGFTLSDDFSKSDKFTQTGLFTESSNFSPSILETPAIISKGTKISKGGIAGIIIACLVLLAIIILLIILFLRRKKSAFIPPEDDPMNIDGLEIPINMYD